MNELIHDHAETANAARSCPVSEDIHVSEIANRLRNRQAGFDQDGSLETPLLLVAAELIERLDSFCREFVYCEENPHEYKLMEERIAELEAKSQWVPASEVKEQGWYWVNDQRPGVAVGPILIRHSQAGKLVIASSGVTLAHFGVRDCQFCGPIPPPPLTP